MDAKMTYLSKLKTVLKKDGSDGLKASVSDIVKQKRADVLAEAVKAALANAKASSSSGGILGRFLG